METGRGIQRILLVGFMGSGKTTIGPIVAQRLRWSFVDLDSEIEERLGSSISMIFDEQGEPFFRATESRVAAELLGRSNVVLATGGGWAIQSRNWEEVPPGTLSVWLDVTCETALKRIESDVEVRPLLASKDLLGQARSLHSRREGAYRKASRRISTDARTPQQIANELASWVEDPREED